MNKKSWLLLCIFTVAIWAAPCFAADPTLIRVKPSYQEASYAPNKAAADKSADLDAPSPREQMYVFWVLGKALSYPLDAVEQFIAQKRAEWKQRPAAIEPVAVPDPFEGIETREIPPAPPALNGVAVKAK